MPESGSGKACKNLKRCHESDILLKSIVYLAKKLSYNFAIKINVRQMPTERKRRK